MALFAALVLALTRWEETSLAGFSLGRQISLGGGRVRGIYRRDNPGTVLGLLAGYYMKAGGIVSLCAFCDAVRLPRHFAGDCRWRC